MKITPAMQYAILAGVAVLGIVYLSRKAGAVVDAINPANPGNIVNSAFESAGQAITGNGSWTLGGWLYDITHPSYAPEGLPLLPTIWNLPTVTKQAGSAISEAWDNFMGNS